MDFTFKDHEFHLQLLEACLSLSIIRVLVRVELQCSHLVFRLNLLHLTQGKVSKKRGKIYEVMNSKDMLLMLKLIYMCKL